MSHESAVSTSAEAGALPLIISVDDHVLEPRDLWTSHLGTEHAAGLDRHFGVSR